MSGVATSLIVVCGNAGTGKTTWAKALARSLGAALLDIDTVSEALVEAAQAELGRDPKDRDSADYKRVFREPIHETLFALAREAYGACVLVAPFTRERDRDDFLDFLEAKLHRRPEVHYFFTSELVRRERLIARNHPRDTRKFRDYSAYSQLGSGGVPPAYPHRWFDTSLSFPRLESASI